MIKCGKCQGTHASVQQVKDCYAGTSNNGTETRRPAFPASTAQTDFIRGLLEQRDFARGGPEATVRLNALTRAIGLNQLSKRDASAAINWLKGFPRKAQTQREAANANGEPAPTAAVVEQDGIYRNPTTGEMWMVKWNRATGDGRGLYASRIVTLAEPVVDERGKVISKGKRRFDYVQGAIRRLLPSWRLTLEQAREFGALYGMCVYGHVLTKPESIRKGIGPICEEKYGWPAGRQREEHAAAA